MKTLNRAFLYVHPTEKFWKLVGPLVEDKDFITFHEPTIYLIDEDIWDEETVIKKYMKKIVTHEFNQLVEHTEIPFEIRDTKDFASYFKVEIGGAVVDCVSAAPERI